MNNNVTIQQYNNITIQPITKKIVLGNINQPITIFSSS